MQMGSGSLGRRAVIAWLPVAALAQGALGQATQPVEFKQVYQNYIAKYEPLLVDANRAWWEANTTGSDAAFERKKKADKTLVELHSDKFTFQQLKALREGGKVTDPVEKRMLDIMYRSFLPGQADPDLQKRIVDLENDIQQIFNTHRGKVGDKEMTENEIREIIGSTKDSAQAEAAWKAYMDVGKKVEGKLRDLVRMRNEMAGQLGFKNFYSMRLALQEIDETEFFKLFDELDELTRAPFSEVKKSIDEQRSRKFGVKEGDLRPWHFGDLFFQEAPEVEGVDLDAVYKDVDLVALTKYYYTSMGFECDDIFARSDLLEKPGKSPHAFATDIDRNGDIRVLCNIKPNLYWADTTLHEIGHAIYDKNIKRDMPFLLREASSAITTEGMAMMFGAVSKNADFLEKARKLDPSKSAEIGKAAAQTLRTEKLMFARWTQVMVRFEHGLYSQPDQDLGKLWWDLKKKYQMLNPPETTGRPDYAAKVHILTDPVYYHSYLMGDLFASQVRNTIARKVLGQSSPTLSSFFGEPKAAAFLKEKVFGPGTLYSWNELTKFATGEPLTAKYFAEQYVNVPK